MQEQIINKETAILAKQKGFDWKCTLSFNDKDISNDIFYVSVLKNYNVGNQCSLCTQALLAKWLRDVHNIDIDISPYANLYHILLFKNKKLEQFFGNNLLTYEQALEEGLKQALNLI